MDFTLEQALASVIRFVQDKAGSDKKLYLDKLPEDFRVPSIYFPVPMAESRQATFGTWLIEIYVDIWFMGADDWSANRMAVCIRDGILMARCLVDMINSDGSRTGKKFRVTEPKLNKIGDRCVSVSTRIKNYVSFRDDGIPIAEYTFTGAFQSYLTPDFRFVIKNAERMIWPVVCHRIIIYGKEDATLGMAVHTGTILENDIGIQDRYFIQIDDIEDIRMNLYLPSTAAGLDGAVLLDGTVRLNDGRDEL